MKYTESQTNQNSNKFGKRPKIKKNPNFRNFDHVRSSQNGYNEENNEENNQHNIGIPQRQNHMIGEIMATTSKTETSQT